MSTIGRARKAHTCVPAIRAVTFDVGGTLIEPWPSVGHVYAHVAAEHGWPALAARALNRQFAAAWRSLRAFNYTKPEWAALVRATFHGLIPTPPSQALFLDIYDRFAEPDAWHIFADVRPALEALAAHGLRLGVLSNWDRRLPPLLRRLELFDCFEVVVVSGCVGTAKPSRAIFQCAAARLRLPAASILHVGDSPALDVRGARAAGLKAVRLARAASRPAPGQVRSLSELPEII